MFSARYVWPLPLVTARNPQGTATNDQAYAVAAPGRMRNDFRAVGAGPRDGFFDVSGNLIEVTGTVTNFDDGDAFHKDFNGNALPNVSWVGGSFEGHGANNRGGYNLDVLTKYGKDWVCEILERDDKGYRVFDVFSGEAKVRAAPFEAIELELALLWAR